MSTILLHISYYMFHVGIGFCLNEDMDEPFSLNAR